MGDLIRDVGLPEKLSFVNHGSSIEISRRWFGGKTVFLTAFAIFWDGFLVFWYSNVAGKAPLVFSLFPLLQVAVGIGITYSALAGWLNRTRVLVELGRIQVLSGPLPVPGNKTMDARSIKQLYSKELISTSRSGRSASYEVRAITHDGKNVKLVGGLESSEQALYIEGRIEKYFGIEDTPVKGAI